MSSYGEAMKLAGAITAVDETGDYVMAADLPMYAREVRDLARALLAADAVVQAAEDFICREKMMDRSGLTHEEIASIGRLRDAITLHEPATPQRELGALRKALEPFAVVGRAIKKSAADNR